MKIKLLFFLILVFVIGCAKKEDESLTQGRLTGTWKWEYSYGGFVPAYFYPTASHYVSIEFTKDGRYIEKHNDTVFLQANYPLTLIDPTNGLLVLENDSYHRPVSLENGVLNISRGELLDSYKKK